MWKIKTAAKLTRLVTVGFEMLHEPTLGGQVTPPSNVYMSKCFLG